MQFDFTRIDTTPALLVSTTFQLSSNLDLCAGLGGSIHDPYGTGGAWLTGPYAHTIHASDNGGGSSTVDVAVLALPCRPTAGGSLFTLDPTKCKFGIWYSSFFTEDPWLATLLRRMEKPHAKIHSLGADVIACLKDGNSVRCASIIEKHRDTTLKELLNLFDEAITQVTESTRRILIVLHGRSGPLGIAVDALSAVCSISDDEIQSPDSVPGVKQFEGLIGFWVQKQTGQKIQLLDPVAIYPQLAMSRVSV